MLPLKVDAGKDMPIYRQISEQIAELIRIGHLVSGDQLPAERELADFLRVARGTVKKAYEALVLLKYIVATRGRGSIVAQVNHGATETRQGAAAQKISEVIRALEEMKFSYREIADLFGLMLAKRREEVAKIAIAAVDCNPEALGIYQKQLAMLTHMSTARIMLAELRQADDPDSILAPFDLILTTVTHIEELQQLAPASGKKTVAVMVSPLQATLISLARLEESSRVGILYLSERFFAIMSDWLRRSGFTAKADGFAVASCDAEDLADFVTRKNILIVPPGYSAQLPGEVLIELNRFRLNGGQLIDFNYQIEGGSLLHLEELIKNLLNHPRK